MISISIAAISCCIWIYLVAGRGFFWRVPLLQQSNAPQCPTSPRVAAIVPARNEVKVVPQAILSMLQQDYAGPLRIIVVDDHSSDGTFRAVQALTPAEGNRLTIISSAALPPGWTGKMWALHQGVRETTEFGPDYILFSDADVAHAPDSISFLVARAERLNLDMISLMPKLSCSLLAERALIPAFVFYFFMLYPPAWVADRRSTTAAAAGGNVLVRADALAKIGGVAAIRGALIDDCALAREIKRVGTIDLGWTNRAQSLRHYEGFGEIGRLISRNAFCQLQHSVGLLMLSQIGLAITFVVPAVLTFSGGWASMLAASAWLLMSIAFWPTLKFYSLAPLWAPLLPVITIFYAGATLHSAIQYWLGRGGDWKGRFQDEYRAPGRAEQQPE